MPVNVNNLHVRFVADKVHRFGYELIKSNSANGSYMGNADRVRLESYLNAVDFAINWIESLPELDLPETDPRTYECEDFPTEVDAENEAVNVAVDILRAGWLETVNGQSARRASGMSPHDIKRVRDIVEHCRNFLTEYVANALPLDLPESSPMEAPTGPGRTGINPA